MKQVMLGVYVSVLTAQPETISTFGATPLTREVGVGGDGPRVERKKVGRPFLHLAVKTLCRMPAHLYFLNKSNHRRLGGYKNGEFYSFVPLIEAHGAGPLVASA